MSGSPCRVCSSAQPADHLSETQPVCACAVFFRKSIYRYENRCIVELSWQSYGQYFANRIGRSRDLCFSPDTSACLQVTCCQHDFIRTAFTSTTLLLFCGRRVARTLEAEMQACNTVKLRISLYRRPSIQHHTMQRHTQNKMGFTFRPSVE